MTTLLKVHGLMILLAFLATNMAVAKIGAMKIEDIITYSDVIVIGVVDSVVLENEKPVSAVVKVTETLKGEPLKELTLDVKPSWICDSSTAIKGERLLLFVYRNKETGSLRINGEGRGRMPLKTRDGIDYASYWPEVIMPDSMTVLRFERSIEILVKLGDVKELIQKTLDLPTPEIEDGAADKDEQVSREEISE